MVSKLLYTCLKTSPSSGPVPCGGSGPSVWYLLDTGADTRIRLDAFTGGLSISPDGRILLGETRGGIVLASTAAPGEVQRVDLPAGVHLGHPVWSPDSANVVLGGGLYLLRVADARTTRLPLAGAAIAWTRDGSRFALAATGWNTGPSPLTVLDANGRVVWSREVLTAFPNPRWSADGSMLSVDVFETVPTPEQPAAERIDVFDGETGAAVVRIRGALACSGPVWAGDSHRLILGAYDTPAMPLVDLSDGTVRWLRGYVIPTPYSSDAGIALVQGGIDSVDLSTGKMTPLARLGRSRRSTRSVARCSSATRLRSRSRYSGMTAVASPKRRPSRRRSLCCGRHLLTTRVRRILNPLPRPPHPAAHRQSHPTHRARAC